MPVPAQPVQMPAPEVAQFETALIEMDDGKVYAFGRCTIGFQPLPTGLLLTVVCKGVEAEGREAEDRFIVPDASKSVRRIETRPGKIVTIGGVN